MPLFLIELTTQTTDRDAVTALLERASDAVAGAGVELLDATVTADHSTAFVVIAGAADKAAADTAASTIGLPFEGPSQVRLVGATEDEVRGARGAADYLVEWDFPTDLTMDTYLQRKAERTPLYDNVPEVAFLRTYVCEDMTKCLCLYDASDEDAVRRAREVVSTPISRLHAIDRDSVTQGTRA